MTSTAPVDATQQLARHIADNLTVETSTRTRTEVETSLSFRDFEPLDVDTLLAQYQRLVDLAATVPGPVPCARYVVTLKPDGNELLVDPFAANDTELSNALMAAAGEVTALHRAASEAAARFVALSRIANRDGSE